VALYVKNSRTYARDVIQYIYSRDGKAYSVINREASDPRAQIEILPRCNAVRGLLRAVDNGLKVRSRKLRLVAACDWTYSTAERRRLPEKWDGCDMPEAAPQRREERKKSEGSERRQGTVYVPSGRGSL
jgi:hypothetical protein